MSETLHFRDISVPPEVDLILYLAIFLVSM